MGPPPPQASHTHEAIAEAAQLMREAVDDIMITLNEAASEGGMVGGMVDSIAEAMSKVRGHPYHDVTLSRSEVVFIMTCHCHGQRSSLS